MAFSFMHLQTIFIIYLLVVLMCTASSLLNHDEECLALFELKQSILHQDCASFDDFGGFQKFDSWRKSKSNASYNGSNGSDCCLWDGVVCSNNDRVIGLDLSRSSLCETINSSSSLFNLVHLQMLNLSMNDFVESHIPSEIARLKQLRTLDLSYSGFRGKIPYEISHLVHLSVLDLSWNPLKLQNFSLEYLLQNLTRLEKLHLSKVDISSSIPHFLANFSSLRSIDLEDCRLQDEFPLTIFHLPQLKYLSIGNNPNLVGSLTEFRNNSLLEYLNLNSTGFAGFIPGSISNLNHLVYLRLSSCHFSGHIPSSLSNMTQLTHLGLGQNEFTGVVPSLVSLSKLIVLDLNNCNFENRSMPYWLSQLTMLNRLSLNRMNISDKIPLSLANLTKLSLVSLRENFIFGHIPSWFMNLTQLSFIDLKGNQLQGPISSAFSNFKSLEYFNIRSNNFSGRVDLNTFVGLDKLETLYLGENRISFFPTNNYTYGTLPKLKNLGLSSCNLTEFPAFLRFQNNMVGLFLNGNKIVGLVPVWIWNNSQESMQIVELSFNFITGFQQSPRFLPWVRLGSLMIMNNRLEGRLPIPPRTTVFYDVSYNNLTGEIPSSICESKSLKLLDLSFNNMNGNLPPCLGRLSNSLLVLNLKQNKFHGTMMNAFTHGCLLRRIDFSENQFIGQLPKSITNCTNLEVLSLGDNFFDDIFPFWLGSLVELQVLILGFNKFKGAVQGPITDKQQFSKLRIIDLSNNNFNGQLPMKYIQSWNAMKSVYVGKSVAINLGVDFNGYTSSYEYSMTLTNKGVKTEYKKILKIFIAIDLSCNKFEGPLPEALQDLQGVQSLNLSNNHLTGRILPNLGNLSNLESLDLSQNKLSGEIPQELLQLGFLAILNVSFNHLYGIIPQGKQFNTFENNSYIGNPGLCGEPLSKECQKIKASTLPSDSNVSESESESESESLLPSDIIDWVVIFIGFASGLVIGIVIGNILYARYSDWFINRFGLGNVGWVSKVSKKRNRVFYDVRFQ